MRDEVWNHRQSVKELKKALKADADLSKEQRDRLANHPTGFATEAETVISFIDEVTRSRETVAASQGQGEMPVANWVHMFKNFKDIREAIDLLILNGQSVDIAARKKALQSQLLAMLRHVVPKLNDKPQSLDVTIRRISSELNLSSETLTDSVVIESRTWSQFVMLAMISAKPRPELAHLRQILTSDLLLRYDPATSSFAETPEYDLLTDVISQAANLGLSDDEGMTDLLEHKQPINSREEREVPAHILAKHLHRMFRLADLISSARALVLALNGQPYAAPTPMPRSPFLDMEKELAAEEVDLALIREWIGI